MSFLECAPSFAMPAAKADTDRWGILRRTLTATGLGLLLIGVLIGLLSIRGRQQVLERLRDQGLQRVEIAGQLIVQQLQRTRADLLYLADNNQLMEFLDGRMEVRQKLEQEYVRFVEQTQSYDQVRCLNEEGQETIRVNFFQGKGEVVPQDQLQPKSNRYYFQEASNLNRGEVFVSRFDLNVEHGVLENPLKPVIRFLTPIHDSAGKKRGLLVLNCLGRKLLEDLSQSRLSGETYLVNRQGDYLRAANPQDSWGWILGHSRTFRGDFTPAWERINRGTIGPWQSTDGLFSVGIIGIRPEGIYWRSPREAPSSGDPHGPSTSPGADSMIVVSHVPSTAIAAESWKLLRPLFATGVLSLAALTVVANWWARAAARNELHAREVAESENRLRILSEELLNAQETERRAISREIHDQLGQLGTAVQLDLKLAARQTDVRLVKERIQQATSTMDQLIQSMHEMASRVRLSALDDLGLSGALRSILQEFESRHGVQVVAQIDPDLDPLPTRIGEHLYRIMQEGLGNAARHAHCSAVTVTVRREERDIYMSLRDNGIGMNLAESERKGRLGILGMRERVELMGGEFSLESHVGQGTTIVLRIPLKWDPLQAVTHGDGRT